MTAQGQLVFETIWDQLETMSEDHARVSFTQRWDQIAHECRSLKRDNDSFGDNNPHAGGRGVQLMFNFEFAAESVDPTSAETLSETRPRKPK
jgi:hypothetical protein